MNIRPHPEAPLPVPHPTCDYCNATEGLRKVHDGCWSVPPSYCCEECFHEFRIGRDEVCFDDLEVVP